MLSDRRHKNLLAVSACLLLLILRFTAHAQTGIIFDISSVKPIDGRPSEGSIRRLDAGIISVSSMTVENMIALFYYVRPYQILGGPRWFREKRFDVTGKASNVATPGRKLTAEERSNALETAFEQMKKVLGERFGLKLHHESKTLPALILVTDKRRPEISAAACSSEYTLQNGVVKGSIRMSSLASLLQAELGSPVRDATGLKGCYSVDTHWTIDPNDESLPSIDTALHELGFRLEKGKADIDVLVVDSVNLPTPD